MASDGDSSPLDTAKDEAAKTLATADIQDPKPAAAGAAKRESRFGSWMRRVAISGGGASNTAADLTQSPTRDPASPQPDSAVASPSTSGQRAGGGAYLVPADAADGGARGRGAGEPLKRRSISPSKGARLSERLGGWLTGAYTTAGTTIGAAAVRGAQAIQRLTGAERYQDLRTAVLRLEKNAAELRGPARLTAVRRWVAVLTELGATTGGAGGANAPAACEAEWQQLHLSPFDAVEQPGSEPLALKANEVLFVDAEHDNEVLTFREVFLGSRALELLVAGYVEVAPESEDDKAALAQLLDATLGGDSGLHGALAAALCSVSAARAAAARPVLVAERPLAELVAEAVGALKLRAGVELLDRKMATLRQDINERAASAAKDFKFNAGEAHPTADSSPETVAAGLAATAEVMQRNATMTHLAAQRAALVAAGAAPQYQLTLRALQEHGSELSTSIAELLSRVEATRSERQEGEKYRQSKLAEMEVGLNKALKEIVAMESRKAALLEELNELDQRLFKAKSAWADLEEGRNVFEEGNAFTMEAVQQQLDQLSASHQAQVAEAAALQQTGELLATVSSGYAAARPGEEAGAAAVEEAAGREYMHAATRHCYYQRATLQLLLRQLRFCAAELQAIRDKQLQMADIGVQYFNSILFDIKKGQQRVALKYLESEAAMLRRLEELATLRATFRAPLSKEGPASPHAGAADEGGVADSADLLLGAQLRPIPMSEELDDVFDSMDRLAAEFKGLERPAGLPAPGEPLPPMDEPPPHVPELDANGKVIENPKRPVLAAVAETPAAGDYAGSGSLQRGGSADEAVAAVYGAPPPGDASRGFHMTHVGEAQEEPPQVSTPPPDAGLAAAAATVAAHEAEAGPCPVAVLAAATAHDPLGVSAAPSDDGSSSAASIGSVPSMHDEQSQQQGASSSYMGSLQRKGEAAQGKQGGQVSSEESTFDQDLQELAGSRSPDQEQEAEGQRTATHDDAFDTDDVQPAAMKGSVLDMIRKLESTGGAPGK